MSELRYPNESREYREARDALFKEEQELVDKVKAVAARRRTLPLGGELKEDYIFQWANEGKVGKRVKFSELFGDMKTLLLYSFMFGPNWDHPCPSCTSLVDGFDRAAISVTADAAFAVVAKAPAQQLAAWAKSRGWSRIQLVSAEKTGYLRDYLGQRDDSDASLLPIMNVFTKPGGAIHHFWASELNSNFVDTIWAYWNLMDLTPDDIARFDRYNTAYKARFGFPFVICARRNKKEAILRAFPERLAHTRDEEIAAALKQIYEIARLRLEDLVV